MLDIMKAIYDMMGKCTYPVLKEETPRQHVEIFFQARRPLAVFVSLSKFKEKKCSNDLVSLFLPLFLPILPSPTEDGQEQGWRCNHRRVHWLLPKCKWDTPRLVVASWRAQAELLTVSSLLSAGWKHHEIDAPLWKRYLTLDWPWKPWKRPSSLADLDSYCVQCAMQTQQLLTIDETLSTAEGHK